MNTKKKPLFRRTQGAMCNKLKGKGWRRPRGKHNKLRDSKKGKGEVPSIGYGADRKMKDLHPCGLEDRIIANLDDIDRIDPKKQAARISSTVGKRKKILLLEQLQNKEIKVVNP
jgi:large subunit ribosomal protein L32e